jgi:hypothetical protein
MIGRRKLTGTAGPDLAFEVGSTVGLLIGSLTYMCAAAEGARQNKAAIIADAVKGLTEQAL